MADRRWRSLISASGLRLDAAVGGMGQVRGWPSRLELS